MYKGLFKGNNKVSSLTLTEALLQNYKSDVFFETGTYNGGGIQVALNVGFTRIYSCELDHYLFNVCWQKFEEVRNVSIFCGESSKIIREICKDINTKITFWLDAHQIGGGRSALLEELDAIAYHHIKDHNILIDDRNYFHTWGIRENVVLDKLKIINPNYKITYEDNCRGKEAIMIATI